MRATLRALFFCGDNSSVPGEGAELFNDSASAMRAHRDSPVLVSGFR